MDRWMNGWMDEWMMGGWMDEWVNLKKHDTHLHGDMV